MILCSCFPQGKIDWSTVAYFPLTIFQFLFTFHCPFWSQNEQALLYRQVFLVPCVAHNEAVVTEKEKNCGCKNMFITLSMIVSKWHLLSGHSRTTRYHLFSWFCLNCVYFSWFNIVCFWSDMAFGTRYCAVTTQLGCSVFGNLGNWLAVAGLQMFLINQ